MGVLDFDIFASKKIHRNVEIARVVEDDFIPKPLLESVIGALVQGNNLTEAIKDNMFKLSNQKFEQAYRYGQTSRYVGSPHARVDALDTSFIYIFEGYNLKEIIDAETGLDVKIEYANYAPLNNTHVGWQWVMENGYDIETNEITDVSSTVGHTCYLNSIVRLYAVSTEESHYKNNWVEWDETSLGGNTPTYTDVMKSITGKKTIQTQPAPEASVFEGVKITYIYEDASGTLQSGEHIIDLSSYPINKPFIHVKYSYMDQLKEVYRYWTYEQGQGTYPGLDNLYSLEYVDPGTYFPVLPVKYKDNRTGRMERRDSYEKLSKYYGIDYYDLRDKIDQLENGEQLTNVMILMGVPISSQNPVEIKYLYEYFIGINAQSPPIQDIATATGNFDDEFLDERVRILNQTHNLDVRSFPPNRYVCSINCQTVVMYLRYGNISRNTVARTGKPGEYTLEKISTSLNKTSYKQDGDPADGNFIEVVDTVDIPVIVIRKQLSPHLCDEILVVNPSMAYNFKGDVIDTNFASDSFLVPLDYSITKTFSINDKAELYPRSLHYLFGQEVTQTIQWYEQTFFANFIKYTGITIIVVLTVASLISGGFFTAFIGALTSGLSTTVMFVLKAYIASQIIKAIGEYAAEKLSPEVALAIALVATVVAIDMSSSSYGLFSGDAFWAENLLMLSSGLNIGATMAMEEDLLEIQKEMELFADYAESKYEELEKAESLLDTNSLLDPLMLLDRVEPIIVFGEHPDDYYNRTVHSGNIGTSAFDLIENYVDISLKLPNIEQTIGGLV